MRDYVSYSGTFLAYLVGFWCLYAYFRGARNEFTLGASIGSLAYAITATIVLILGA